MWNSQKVVKNILGNKKIRTDRISQNAERAVPGKKCWNCGKIFQPGDDWYYYYHGDQDDRVCIDCAKKLKHTDTGYQGMSVFDIGNG